MPLIRSVATLALFTSLALGSSAQAAAKAPPPDAPIAAPAPVPGTPPQPGWIWQGVWQDGRWSGQWIPAPASTTPPPAAPYAPSAYAPSPYAPPPYAPSPYAYATAGSPYGNYVYVPMGYTLVPVQPAKPQTYTETVTTEYVDVPRHRVIRAKPHKDKRVYTGN